MPEPARSVLQVVTSNERRGAELFAFDLGRALEQRGWLVQTVALAPGNGAEPLDVPSLGKHPLGMRTLRSLRATMRKADITVAHGSRTLPATAIAGLGSGCNVVYRNIGDPMFWASSLARRQRVAWAMRRAVRVVAISADAARTISSSFGVAETRISVIPQPADSSRFHPATKEERAAARRALGLPLEGHIVLFVGALSAEKDPALAVAATVGLETAHLAVAGDGGAGAEMAAAAARTPGRVHLLGVLPDPTVAYAAADALILSSRSEGTPAVLIEAGLSGLPTVTTDVGFVRDIVVDGHTGIIVASREPAELTRALRAALTHAKQMGIAARQRCVEQFSLDEAVKRWDALLHAAMAR